MTLKLIGSRTLEDIPKINIKWARGRDKIDYLSALIFLILGKRGSGKSALIENLALRYPHIVDLFGSRDNENLAWCRETSPIDDILLLHGPNVDLNCSWETCSVDQLTYNKIMEYEATVTCNSFYSSQESRFLGMNKIIDQFWGRFAWKKPIFVAIREASSFIYSRIKMEGVNMKMAKSDFIYFQREMRHFGYALGIDTIRWTSIDKEMRDLADHLIIKKVGAQGLPRDLSWLYKYIDPMTMARLAPSKFLILTHNASIGYGTSQLPQFHKEEGVDLIKELGIGIECGEEIEESSTQRVGDKEHAKIVEQYNKDIPMNTIASNIKRSSYTIHKHVRDHNADVKEHGVCRRCERVASDLMDTEVFRGR